MGINLIVEPIRQLVECLSVEHPDVKRLYSKVGAVVKGYANYRERKVSEIRLLDLFNEDSSLRKTLTSFIAGLPQPADKSTERHKFYKQEARANFKTLIKRIFVYSEQPESSAVREPERSFLTANVPDFFETVVQLLPRIRLVHSDGRRFFPATALAELRLQEPLTDIGYYLLQAYLKVIQENQVDSLGELFGSHFKDIKLAVKLVAPSNLWRGAIKKNRRISQSLGLSPLTVKKRSISFENYPSTFKKQWQTFVDRVYSGWANTPEIVSLAAQHGISFKFLEEKTVQNYQKAISVGLSHISYKDDLSVTDLLRLESVESDSGSESTCSLVNPFIEVFRKFERERQTDAKRSGFDSGYFEIFCTAIKTVAAYNGIFHLQTPFNASYKTRIDSETKRKRKEIRKRTFSIAWLDGRLARLELDFISLIYENRFKRENKNYTQTEISQSLRFCFFYVSLVTLRYIGVRQQAIRNCVYNRNIIFNPDSSITFRWEADQVKNDALIEGTITPTTHTAAYGLLIRTLKLYHEKVYKYLLKNHGDDFGRQFFLKLRRDNTPGEFKSVTEFCEVFKFGCRRYMNLEEVVDETGSELMPQFFRQIAGDWLHHVLGIDTAKTAKGLGDSRHTVENHYLRRDYHNLTPVFDEASEIVRQRETRDREKNAKSGEIRAALEKELRQVNEQLRKSTDQSNQLRTDLEVSSQENQSLREENLFLRKQLAQSQEQILERIKNLQIQND